PPRTCSCCLPRRPRASTLFRYTTLFRSVRAPQQLDEALAAAPAGLVLSLGVIDGRNVWRADLSALLDRLEPVIARRGPDLVQLRSEERRVGKECRCRWSARHV